ncbi:hypothetical protein KY359_02240 [Candidatus Woesearchaeota archaeon]|nr:hypothetical protein [Candidatus Woesearchaeota archaeon]
MGLLDKAKFWQKKEDDAGDLSDLGDFGFDESPGGTGGLGGGMDLGGDFPPLGGTETPGARPDMPTHAEELQPSKASLEMSDRLGLKPETEQPQQYPQRPTARPAAQSPAQQMHAQTPQPQPQPQYQQQYAPSYPQSPDLADLAKEIEIVHAKLDAIRSSLDSINQRLATLERIASGDTRQPRYSW